MRKTRTKLTHAAAAKPPTKLQNLIDLLQRPEGADLAELMSATAWQAHSVRGAIAGTLKRKGCQIESAKVEGRRIYRIAARSVG
jgi:hypothetical protein